MIFGQRANERDLREGQCDVIFAMNSSPIFEQSARDKWCRDGRADFILALFVMPLQFFISKNLSDGNKAHACDMKSSVTAVSLMSMYSREGNTTPSNAYPSPFSLLLGGDTPVETEEAEHKKAVFVMLIKGK